MTQVPSRVIERQPDAAGSGSAQFERYGAVLLLEPGHLHVLNATDNAASVLGIAATALIGRSLADVVDPSALQELRSQLRASDGELGWYRTELLSGEPVKLHGFRLAHGPIALDVVPVSADMLSHGAEAIERVANWSERLLSVDEPVELLRVASSHVTSLTGFGAAWACRIEDEGHGIVIAAAGPRIGNVVGHLINATDMPPGQPRVHGRALPFFVADIDAPPVRLHAPPPADARFDASSLHRPYPEYLQRLGAAGVRASLSVPLTVGGRLWGRIIAHHHEARRIAPAMQSELRLLGAAISTHLTELLQLQEARDQLDYAHRSSRILRSISRSTEIFDGLVADPEALLDLGGTPSALVSIEGVNAALGDELTPEQREHVLALARAKLSAPSAPPVMASVGISASDAAAPAPGAYLAVKLGDDARNLIVWVRPDEHPTGPRSAPRPDANPDNQLFADMTSRFEQQRSVVRPWSAAQIQGLAEFRSELAALTVDRYQQLAQRATALSRSNEEFNAFAYTAAHDLKQPIRGIRQYVEFFLEDAGHKLDGDERGQLETVQRLSSRMSGLVDDLMRYAELGDATGRLRTIDLRVAVDEAVDLLPPEATQESSIVTDASEVTADPSALRQLLLNLIGNALKYRGDSPAKVRVAVTTLDAVRASAPPAVAEFADTTQVLTVEDDGIGIPPQHHDEVFRLFRQLDAASQGSGAGLALCRRIAHRHGGEIWLTSVPDGGTTVYTALGSIPEVPALDDQGAPPRPGPVRT
jgi:light-regulated signal transduction histidine kinase (bacteriophytochrome)